MCKREGKRGKWGFDNSRLAREVEKRLHGQKVGRL